MMSSTSVYVPLAKSNVHTSFPVIRMMEEEDNPAIQMERLRRCRRALFMSANEVDHQKLKKHLQTFNDDELEQKKVRWNFDFKHGKPLPGPIVWEAINQQRLHISLDRPEISQETHNNIPSSSKKLASRSKQSSMNDFTQHRKSNPVSSSEKRKLSENAASSSPKIAKLNLNAGK